MSIEKLKQVSDQILSRLNAVKGRGEEATKQALVLPMLDALGYDIWNPEEVCPEYEADFAIKKGGQKEKVDLAISLNGVPKIYFEVKSVDNPLDGHQGQLARYFNATTSVSLGVLTNGVEWRFFTDTGDSNIMDANPFHVVRLEAAADQGLDVMARFGKSVFSPEAIRDYATELKYTNNIANILRQELDLGARDPSEHFIRWILKSEKVYEGVVNMNVVDRFRPIVKTALTRVVREIVRRSLTAMEEQAAGVQPTPTPTTPATPTTPEPPVVKVGEGEQDTGRPIITTEKELRCFEIVKAVFDGEPTNNGMIFDPSIRKDVPIEMGYKDTTGYFAIYFNKTSWWVVRLLIESKRPWVGFYMERSKFLAMASAYPQFPVLETSTNVENRLGIDSPEDLLVLKPLILEAMKRVVEERKAG